MGSLSHGWLSPGDPDPAGARMRVVCNALWRYPHIEGLFWDFASLYQRPRTEAQQEAFHCALKVMGDAYASAIGTTVLQLKEIPPRPSHFDGALCLFDLKMTEETAVSPPFAFDFPMPKGDCCSLAWRSNASEVSFAASLSSVLCASSSFACC